MDSKVEMITVDDMDKAAEHGFFCYKSKPKSDGYRRKLAWLEQRFAEGLRIKIIHEDGRSVAWASLSTRSGSTPGDLCRRPAGLAARSGLWQHRVRQGLTRLQALPTGGARLLRLRTVWRAI